MFQVSCFKLLERETKKDLKLETNQDNEHFR